MAHKNKENRSPWKERQSPKSLKRNSSQGRRSHVHNKKKENFSFNEADDRIYDIFRHHGFSDFDHAKRQTLTKFYFLILESQKTHNFTRLVNLREVAIKHFIDSLLPAQLTELKFPLLDIGTGPGFPGIPLKIMFPKKEQRILLAEGVQSRVEFLKHAREELKLEGLDIIGKYIDESFVYPVNGVITRAVEDVQNTLRKSINCLQTGGRVYLMKGPNVDPEIKTAQKEWGEYYELVEDHEYEILNTPHRRRLLVYEKLKPYEKYEHNPEGDNE